ncbi:replication protein VP4 [Microviridae Fen7918_21]|uniref:replication protein VP4 n=1 Tax=Microviridae Fen7918_21 TaxID=1655661 RepID=UPI00063D63ED|nr:replication protein VP4 [Microviridae Fen7918_21]AKI26948.1 replication protein VP4 [Microviridae Fen7918_21]
MAHCITPLVLQDKPQARTISVACGRCPACHANRISGWSFRLMQESKISTSSFFVTLTYEKTIHTKNGLSTLVKSDIQKFFKRLRKNHTGKPIKYYCAGEYGGTSWRPHYHIILFNSTRDDIRRAWHLDNTLIGNIHIGTVNGASVGYTLKYINKTQRIPLFEGDDRAPEFSLMSKGLGKNYINKRTIKWHRNDMENRLHLPLAGGSKAYMPRYYKQKIYAKYEVNLIVEKLQEKNIAQTERNTLLNPKLPSETIEHHFNQFRKDHLKSKKSEKL